MSAPELPLVLAEASVEAVARRVVELLRAEALEAQRPQSEPRGLELVDAAEIARRFGVERGWVYRHASELGALRLGGGTKPRLRFNPDTVAEALHARCASEGSHDQDLPAPARMQGVERVGLRHNPARSLPKAWRDALDSNVS